MVVAENWIAAAAEGRSEEEEMESTNATDWNRESRLSNIEGIVQRIQP